MSFDFSEQAKPLGQALALESSARVRAEARAQLFENALRAICTASDSGPWIDVYRDAGGGYEGLQAIAEHALSQAETSEGPT